MGNTPYLPEYDDDDVSDEYDDDPDPDPDPEPESEPDSEDISTKNQIKWLTLTILTLTPGDV